MRSRHLFWQVPLLLLITIPFWWRFAAKALEPHKKIRYSDILVEKKIVMDRVKLTQDRAGNTELIIHADHLESHEDQKIIHLQNVTGRLFSGSKTINISGSEAVYNSQQKVITLLDKVHLTDNDSFQLDTDVLRFLTEFNKIKSAAPLKATSGNMKVSGTSFFYDLNSGDFRVGKRVICNIR